MGHKHLCQNWYWENLPFGKALQKSPEDAKASGLGEKKKTKTVPEELFM